MTALEWTLLRNSMLDWTIAIVVAVVVLAGLYLAKGVVVRQLKRLAERVEAGAPHVALHALKAIRPWFMVLVAVRAGSLALLLPGTAEALLHTAVVVGVLLQVALSANAAAMNWQRRYTEANLEEDAAAVTTMRAAVFMGRLIGWTIVLLLALDNLGVNITALIAGLGVGGIAVALAVQNILGDLFASLSIVIDKPFVVGDFIIVDEYLGTVAHIGLKTTRITSLGGEQLVFANNDLLNSRIRNFKRMNERRVVFSFGVVYQTRPDTLERIPLIVREIIDGIELARFDRAHFKEFGSSSLAFEVVYFVLVPDFNSYMDIQQEINLALYRKLEAEGVQFAFPTQTLYVHAPASENGASWSGVGEEGRS